MATLSLSLSLSLAPSLLVYLSFATYGAPVFKERAVPWGGCAILVALRELEGSASFPVFASIKDTQRSGSTSSPVACATTDGNRTKVYLATASVKGTSVVHVYGTPYRMTHMIHTV